MKANGLRRVAVVLGLAVFLFLVLTKSKSGQELLASLKRLGQQAGQKTSLGVLEPQTVVEQINEFRKKNKLVELKRNENLDRAALARLTVIEASEDYNGKTTGLTLENAIRNNGYPYSTVGELDAVNVIAGMDLIKYWADDPGTLKLIKESGFRDIGIASKTKAVGADVVVILAKPVSGGGAARPSAVTWGGIELWKAINKRRVELGVNPLSQREELCTVASIRLNQLLDLGKLDGHAGLEPTLSRSDLAYIRDKYTIAEFLVYGYPTAEASVTAWENTLGHRELLAGGQYVWGCAYAQNTFGVAIAAF